MSPILGIWASSIQPSLNASSFDSIATVDVSSSTNTISFTSIPSTYKHLQIRFTGRLTSGSQNCTIRFNSDTTSTNYYLHILEGDGSTAYAGAGNNFPTFNGSYSTANLFSASVTDILDYTNTNKYKVTRSLYGIDANGSGQITLGSGLWKNTAAITQIDLVPNFGGNWAQYTKAALYGIKG